MRMNKWRILSYTMMLVMAAIYLSMGLYTLQSGEQALILRFGKVVARIADSGVHYHLPYPVDQVVKTHVSKVQTVALDENASMPVERLTGDENLLVVQALVSFDIKSPKDSLFQVQDLPSLIRAVGQNCLSRQLASVPVDEVMTSGKSVLRLVMKKMIQERLDTLQSGVNVISVELKDISPPEDVSVSFNAVSDARVKKQRFIKEAEGYANVVLPETRGKVSKILAESRAYVKEVEDSTLGRVQSFHNLFAEYTRNPGVTAQLKYMETLQDIAQKSRIIIDSDPEKTLYYLQKNPSAIE